VRFTAWPTATDAVNDEGTRIRGCLFSKD
jgi:hypothetical protein